MVMMRKTSGSGFYWLIIAGALVLPAGAFAAPDQGEETPETPSAETAPEAAPETAPEAEAAETTEAATEETAPSTETETETAPAPEAAETTEAATEEADPATEDATVDDEEREWYFRFDAFEQYRFRYSTSPVVDDTISLMAGDNDGAPGSETDHDLRLMLSGTLFESEDHFLADVSMGLWADVDGNYPDGDYSGFASPYDESQTFGIPMWIDLYTLYAEYHSHDLFALGRAGRQVSDHGPLVSFDGGAVELALSRPFLDVFAFGGRSVHFFEIDADFFEDWLASGGFVIRPFRELRIELDYRFEKEDLTPIDSVDDREAIIDHSYGVAAWYRYEDWLYFKGYFRGINDAPALAGGATSAEWFEQEVGFDIKVDAQIVTLREINEKEDPFYAVLGESLPHIKLNADLWKAFTTKAGTYTIHGGWGGRLLTADDATDFNRDYGRAYLWFQAVDIGVAGPFAGIVGEFHYTHKSADLDSENTITIGGSAGWELDPLKAELGTYYQRYKYDYYVDVKEIESVRTYFGEVIYRPFEWLSAGLRYEFEVFDRKVHTAMLTLTQRY